MFEIFIKMRLHSSALSPIRCSRGFLLIEALLLILILAVSFVSFTAVFSQALKVSSLTREVTQGLLKYEGLLFEIENGIRPDLARYGGQGDLGDGFAYEIQSEEEGDFFSNLKSNLFWKNKRSSLDFEFFIVQGIPQ